MQSETSARNANWVVIVYLLHLMVPACLFLDVAIARLRDQITLKPVFPHAIVAAIAALWLVAGLGLLLLSRNRQVFAARVSTPLLSVYTVYLTVGFAEAVGRYMGLTSPVPTLQLPLTRAVKVQESAITPGVSGLKTFTINPMGLRGPMPPKSGRAYRILAVGGSTTVCVILDDSEEWAHVLMNELNAGQKTTPVWVGNAGAAGRNTVHHTVLMQWMPGVLHLDMAIFLIGVNDMGPTLAYEGASTQRLLEADAGFQGDLPRGMRWRSKYPFYRRLRLLPLVELAFRNLKQRFVKNDNLPWFGVIELRNRRALAPVVPLPDLSTGLLEYRSRILKLANRCHDLEMRCLFLTQPTMWRSDLTPAEEHLFWTGYTGHFYDKPKGFISSSDLARGMEMYNRTLLDVCRESGLECFDIAAHIPKDTSAFFDEEHFNEGGARIMAQTLKQYLISKPPFRTQVTAAAGLVPH